MNNEIQNLINEKNVLNNTIRLRRERHNQEMERLRQEYFFYDNSRNIYRSNSVLNNEIEAQNRAFEEGLNQEFGQELQARNDKLNAERERLTELLASKTQEYNNLITRSFRIPAYMQAPMVFPEGLQKEIEEIQSDLKAINESLNTNGIELNGVKPQAKVEQRQQAPVQTEPVQAEPAQTAPAQAEPVQPELVQTEPVQAEPVQTEPEQPESVQPEPVQTEPAQAEPVQTEPVQTEPVQAELAQAEPMERWPWEQVQEEPAQTEPVQAEPVQTELVQPEPVQAELAQAEPMERWPWEQVQEEPAQTEPVQTELAQAEPMKRWPWEQVQEEPAQTEAAEPIIQDDESDRWKFSIFDKNMPQDYVSPVQPEPVQPEPVQPEPVQPEPVQHGKLKVVISKICSVDVYEQTNRYYVNEDSKLDETLTSSAREKGFDDKAINNMMETLNTYQGDKRVLIALLITSRSDAESVKYIDDYLSVLKGENSELSTFDLEYDLSQKESFSKKEFKTIKKYALNSSKFAKINGIKMIKLRLASRKISDKIRRLFRRKNKNTPLLSDENQTPEQPENNWKKSIEVEKSKGKENEPQVEEEIELTSYEETEQGDEER